ncbi:MAG: ribonuclease III [Bacteroidetes bacterium]|nr:ribonuclease III [Bacteroidota bacterium]
MFKIFRRFISNLFPGGKQANLLKFEREKLVLLEKRLGIKFGQKEIFIKALTHRSYLEISPEFEKSNERLEFLGDAVLGLVAAETLFQKFPNKHEGFLTKYRSHLVDKEALFEAAKRINLFDFVLYDHRYVRGSEEGKKTIIADCLEALIGAIYLDKGLKTAEHFIVRWIITPNFQSGDVKVDKNFKGQLLEITHSEKLSAPKYKVVSEEGPDHDKKFVVDVIIGSESYGIGEGKNKKSAEQEAAKIAIDKIFRNNN